LFACHPALAAPTSGNRVGLVRGTRYPVTRPPGRQHV